MHTRELDRFYELPTSQLPAIPLSVRPLLHQRGHRTKVRVTHDQKTGEQLAQIIKIRIADLDVYSPGTAFDWRVSVNLEMPYEGDLTGLTEVTEAGNGNKASKRSKDRMTYRHLAYQIDLTQVTLQGEVCITLLHSQLCQSHTSPSTSVVQPLPISFCVPPSHIPSFLSPFVRCF